MAEPPRPTNSYQSSSGSLPSYRSNASTYVASRDGDLSDPRAWGKDPIPFGGNQPNGGQQYGGQSYGQPQPNYQLNGNYGGANGGGNAEVDRPNKLRKEGSYGREQSSYNDGYGARPGPEGGYPAPATGGWNGPKESPFNRGQAGREAFDPYSRGERNLEADRNALFAGSSPAEGGPTSNRFGGPSYGNGERRPTPNPGEENEEDVEAIKSDIRNVKNQTADSMSNALRLAKQAEQTGMATLLKLGSQSGTSIPVYARSIAHFHTQRNSLTRSATSTSRRASSIGRKTTLMRSGSSIGPSSSPPSP